MGTKGYCKENRRVPGGERQRARVASPLQRDGGRTLCDAKCDVEFVLLVV
jgi:hypothetical protein